MTKSSEEMAREIIKQCTKAVQFEGNDIQVNRAQIRYEITKALDRVREEERLQASIQKEHWIQAEREECAKLAESVPFKGWTINIPIKTLPVDHKKLAQTIRQRGNNAKGV